MNKPLDPERIANENAAEEKQINTTLEDVVVPIEDVAEIIVVSAEAPVTENQTEIEPVEKIEEPEKPKKEKVKKPKKEEVKEPEIDPVAETIEKIEEEETPEEELVVDELIEQEEKTPEFDKLSKEEIVDRLIIIVEEPAIEATKNKIDALKQAFYKIKRVEIETAKQSFIEAGGLEENFEETIDEIEEKLKQLLAVYREKRASLTAEIEKEKEKNLIAKKAIIEKLKGLIESKEDFYKVYNEFRKLQQEWKEIKQIPQAAVNDLWKDYQHYTEKFYDLVKINNEMRDYDFKKNLELKQALCEAVERLDEGKDVISAFYQLQKLHQEWREIGPVAKELREDIWSRFKKASAVINKKHQDHFESLRSLEQRNLEEKIALCEEIETIDYSKLTVFKNWDEQNKRVLELQDKWKTVGFAPKRQNVKVFERFRAACDVFFTQKNDFYKGIKESMDVNLEKKKSLCEQAEALKDSQDWKVATDKLIALQKEWKSTGPVSRKHSESIWKRFIQACDYFFEQKNTHFSSQKSEEVENLKKKKSIIEKINEIDKKLNGAEAVATIRELMQEFNNIGFVPFREKDKLHKEYRTAIDNHFDRLKIGESERRLQSIKSNLSDISKTDSKSKNKILSEREKLMRTYERLKSDIQTYENNIGFLSVSSKGGGGLVKEMNHKIETLKEELNLIVKKIDVIDENLGLEK